MSPEAATTAAGPPELGDPPRPVRTRRRRGPGRGKRRGRRLASSVAPPLVAFAVLVVAWELFVRLGHVRAFLLPAPSDVVQELADHPGVWWHDALVTGKEALLGFVVAFLVALLLAVLMVHVRPLERALLPVITMVQVTPIIALAPPLVVWLGFGLSPKVLMAALITFIPFTINAITGLRAVDPDSLEVMRSVDASRREVFTKLRLPHALPYLLAAARVCVGLALIGALVAEWSGSSEGLGYTMVRAQRNLDAAKVWAAVVVLTVLGLLGTLVVTFAERRMLRWHPSTSRR
jgi:NitT/TauT family transport system permease protein